MNDDDDITFCQVALAGEPGSPGIMHLTHSMAGMSIAENSSDMPGGAGDKNMSPLLWKDKLEDGSVSAKQAVFGSLAFNVVDASSDSKSRNSPRKSVVGDSKIKVLRAEENKFDGRKAAPRAKVPFEKGYSQMNWLKLTRTHPDLAGLKGSSNRRLVSMEEVKQQQMEGSMWIVLKGRVYNISSYLKFHPGGVDILVKAVGNDFTSLFNKYHAWVNAEFLLEKCLVGMLDDTARNELCCSLRFGRSF